MAAKKKVTQNTQPVVTPPTTYLKSEIELMRKLFRNCHTGAQAQEVMSFYKKYVNPKFKAEVSNCGGCGTGFMDKFKETRDWCAKHQSEFIN